MFPTIPAEPGGRIAQPGLWQHIRSPSDELCVLNSRRSVIYAAGRRFPVCGIPGLSAIIVMRHIYVDVAGRCPLFVILLR